MSKLRTGLWKGICVAVVVPILMILAVPVRALVFDGGPQGADEVSPDAAVISGSITSFDTVPLPDVMVTSMDGNGNVLATTTTGPNGEYAMEVPGAVGAVTVVAAGGAPSGTVIKPGAAVKIDGKVPADKVIGATKPGWWAGMATTSKAAIIGLPVAASAGAGFALSNSGSSRHASPVTP